jgi:hypothetical protein
MIRIRNELTKGISEHVMSQDRFEFKHYYFDKRHFFRQIMRKRLMSLNKSKYFSLKLLNSSHDLIDVHRLSLISPYSCNSFLTCKENVSLKSNKINFLDAHTQTSLNFVEMDFILEFLRTHSNEYKLYLNSQKNGMIQNTSMQNKKHENSSFIIPPITTEPFFLHKISNVEIEASKDLFKDGFEKSSEYQISKKVSKKIDVNESKTNEMNEYASVRELTVSKSHSARKLSEYTYVFDQNIQKRNPLLMAELKTTLKRPNFNLKSLNS